MTERQWHYVENGQSVGPVDEAVLRERASSGLLGPADLVWTEGMPDWIAAGTVPQIITSGPDATFPSGDITTQQAPEPRDVSSGNDASATYLHPVQHGQTMPRALTYAGFWKRAVAYILDQLILAIAAMMVACVLGIVLVPLIVSSGVQSEQAINRLVEQKMQDYEMLISIVSWIINIIGIWLYHALMESSRWQATPGKLALGIRVTDLNGHRISFGRATGRHFGKIVSSIPLLIGWIMAAFTEKKQALHDMVAGCLVINK